MRQKLATTLPMRSNSPLTEKHTVTGASAILMTDTIVVIYLLNYRLHSCVNECSFLF